MKIAEFFFKEPKVDLRLLGENYKNHLQSANAVLSEISDWKLEKINGCLIEEIKKKDYKTGPFFMDLRIAVTGKEFTPPINESITILGKVETLDRIGIALNL
jgi:glutamyl/glutaminyl-tRNA synthetase